MTTAVDSLPEAWAQALEQLVVATANERQPWGCPGGTVALVLTGAGATLSVEDRSGRVVARAVATPDEIVPTGKALLATSAPRSGEPTGAVGTVAPDILLQPARARAAADVAKRSRPLLQAPERAEPRLRVAALVGPRYAGVTNAVWGGATIRGTVPLDEWSAGLWARYDLPAYMIDPVPLDFSMSEVSVGGSIGHRLLVGPVELAITLDPSLVVLSMEGGVDDANGNAGQAEGGKIDGRMGLALHAATALVASLRATLTVDGEIAPANLAEARRIDPALPPLPAYTLGAALGIEAVIR